MRERLFRTKRPEEGTGWTVNNKAGWIVTLAAGAVLVFAMTVVDSAVEERVTRLGISIVIILIWAVAFTLFAKWESERP